VASLNTTAKFVVVSQLAVTMLLGSGFINTHVKTINHKDASVTVSDDSRVSLLRRIQSNHLVNQAKVRCSKSVTIAPYTEAVIRAKSPIAGLYTLYPIARDVEKAPLQWLMAYGITDIYPEKKIPAKVTNYSRNSIFLRKGQFVGQALREQPDTIAVVELVDKEADPEQVIPTTKEETPPVDHLPNDL
jgi:hypothetical protein